MSERFRLRSSVEPIDGGDGSLYLVRAADPDLVVRDADAADHELLDRLARDEPTIAELARALALEPAAVCAKLDALIGAGVVVPATHSPALEPLDADRYARQLPYLADLGDAHDLQRRIGTARVVVIGCGGLGTWALAALAGAGVRQLRIVDDDVVESSNLNRQILYSPADLGRPKVEAATAWLRAFDSRIAVETVIARIDGVDAAGHAVTDADAVVLVADSPPYELGRWVNAACAAAGVPFITGGQLPPLIRVGPLYRPGVTACFACHEETMRAGSAGYGAYVERMRAFPVRGATLGPASGIVGTMLAMELLHLLVGVEPATAGAALLVDLRTLQTRREPIERVAGCAVCSGVRL